MLRCIRSGLALVFLCLALPFPAQAALFQSGGALDSEARMAGAEQKLLIVLFELEDCDYCRALRADVFPAKGLEKRLNAHFRTVAVYLDGDEAITTPSGETLPRKAWAEKLRVLGTPAFIFFDGQGQLVYRHLGSVADAAELQLLASYVQNAAYEEQPWSDYLAKNKKSRPGAKKNRHH
jgi:thioredoxin-related protein